MTREVRRMQCAAWISFVAPKMRSCRDRRPFLADAPCQSSWVSFELVLEPPVASAASSGFRSSRWMFSIRACSMSSRFVASRTKAGMVLSPAIRARATGASGNDPVVRSDAVR